MIHSGIFQRDTTESDTPLKLSVLSTLAERQLVAPLQAKSNFILSLFAIVACVNTLASITFLFEKIIRGRIPEYILRGSQTISNLLLSFFKVICGLPSRSFRRRGPWKPKS